MSLIIKIYSLLNSRERCQTLFLVLLMLFGALLEAAGIGIILPFIALVLDPGIITHYPAATSLYALTGAPTHQTFILWACLLLVCFFIFKNIFLFLLCYLQNRFVARKQIAMSRDLFTAYLSRPYDFFFSANSADLQRNLHGSVSMVANGVLLNLLGIFSEAVVAATIFALLLAVDPVSSGAALSFSGAALALSYMFSHKRVQRYSRISTTAFAGMIKWLNQGIGSIKELKVLGRERYFLDKFLENSTGGGTATAKHQVLLAFPRVFFEIVTVTAIVLIVLIHLLQGKPPQTLMATLGLFAMAAFRLMPAMNRIATMLTGIRFGMVQLDYIYADLISNSEKNLLKPVESARLEIEKEIRITGMSYRYPVAENSVLNNVNLLVRQGESIGIIGASGSGKSTFVNLLLGLLSPKKGLIEVDGSDISTKIRRWQCNIGYIPQQIYLIDDNITRNVALGIPDDRINQDRVWEVLEIAQLADFVRSLPNCLQSEIGEQGICLSGGQRQRIGIARALYHDPQLLVLDEATSALDHDTERSFMAAIEKLEGYKTLVIVAHRLTTLERCNAVYKIENGNMINVKETINDGL